MKALEAPDIYHSPDCEGDGRRVQLSDDGSHYISLSREVSVYRDKLTGDALVAWTNSYTGEQSEVSLVTMIMIMMMMIMTMTRYHSGVPCGE